ncbi:MAG: GH3 auxin-responsive promoter family protein [Isosphaeraceae bacterium]|nr:GH3 auxin-responsive promoter family protein [Isosphaeraceae bacterium]
MSASSRSPLGMITGSPLVRGAVNAGFHAFARRRVNRLAQADPIETQRRVLLDLVARARSTRFGRDHGFASISTVEQFQRAVPIRTYESLWNEYLAAAYPTLDDVTWPGRIPFFALTSGTTQGATKYIPVSRAMVESNTKAGLTMIAHHLTHRPDSRLFHGRLFFLGGSTNLEEPAPGVRQGDLSGIAALEVQPALRPYTFPPLDLAFETNWEKKLSALAERSARERITMVGGVPSWLLVLFERLFQITGKSTIAEVWPNLEMIVHGGVKFEPYRSSFLEILGDSRIRLQETYPCSEGFIAFGDPATDHLRLLFDHGIFHEFIPVDELDAPNPTRRWLSDVEVGVNYAIVVSTCAGMWGHLIGDTVRFESLDPPLLTFTGRTKYTLSAFGEHLISEEVEGGIAVASDATGAAVRDWHVGPVFEGALGRHRFLIEFQRPPGDLEAFRVALDADLGVRNADYQAHRAEGVGLPFPEILVVRPGGVEAWMRSKGKLGGQHKFPRMDNAGTLTDEIARFLREHDLIAEELPARA